MLQTDTHDERHPTLATLDSIPENTTPLDPATQEDRLAESTRIQDICSIDPDAHSKNECPKINSSPYRISALLSLISQIPSIGGFTPSVIQDEEPESIFLFNKGLSWWKTFIMQWVARGIFAVLIFLGISDLVRFAVLMLQANKISIPLKIYERLDLGTLASESALFLAYITLAYVILRIISLSSAVLVSAKANKTLECLADYNKKISKKCDYEQEEIEASFKKYRRVELLTNGLFFVDMLVQIASITLSFFALTEAVGAISMSKSMFPWSKTMSFDTLIASPMLVYSITSISISLLMSSISLVATTLLAFQGVIRYRDNAKRFHNVLLLECPDDYIPGNNSDWSVMKNRNYMLPVRIVTNFKTFDHTDMPEKDGEKLQQIDTQNTPSQTLLMSSLVTAISQEDPKTL